MTFSEDSSMIASVGVYGVLNWPSLWMGFFFLSTSRFSLIQPCESYVVLRYHFKMTETYWDDPEFTNDPLSKVFLTTSPLQISEAVEFVKSEHAGAVIVFGGTTRDSFEGKGVTLLSYEAHQRLAVRTLSRIAREAKEKFRNDAKDELIHKIYLCHRLGDVPVKEESIIVCLSATHRQEGWDAAMWILERVKESAEIWKKENYEDGTSSWKENENSNVKKV